MIKIIILLWLTSCVCCDKSLTIVLDASGSMDAEMTIIKNNIEAAINNINNRNIINYVMVPFSNPNVGSRILSSSANGLIDAIRNLEIRRGHMECTEISLEAIEKAIDASKSNSYIFLFTDAEAKDYYNFDTINRLCRKTQSQVFIFRSGKCRERLPETSEKVYYDVAKSCNGSVFQLDIKDLHQAFSFLKEVSNVDWTHVEVLNEFTGAKQFHIQDIQGVRGVALICFSSINQLCSSLEWAPFRNVKQKLRKTITVPVFSMDEYTKNVMIAVSCLSPYVDVTGETGRRPNVQTVMATSQALVLNVIPDIGNYNIETRCYGPAAVTFYRRLSISFQYGFSPVRPRNIYETVARPIPGKTFMYVALPKNSNARIVSLKLLWNYQESTELQFESADEERSCYIEYTFESANTYKIEVTCMDMTSNVIVLGTSDYILPQKPDLREAYNKPSMPRIEVTTPETTLVEFNTPFTLSCKVFGYPSPEIWWEDEIGERIPSQEYLLEIPHVYISYTTIENVAKNSSVVCKCRNSEGDSTLTIDYYVNRPFTFDVIQIPSDTTIAYGEEGKLYCEVSAYPEAEIKWYHNDTLIEYTENNIEVVPEEHVLFIKSMNMDDAGEYKCEMSNQVELKKYTATVYITGLDPPQIHIDNTEIILQPGDSCDIECSVISGTPTPEVSWKYKKDYNEFYEDLPGFVEVDGNSIKIESVTTSHKGVYFCEASNIIGKDSKHVTLKVQYAPKIENDVDIKNVSKSKLVELPCRVDAAPPATVRWETYLGDVIVTYGDHHTTDENNTHRFFAQANDSGMYHCIAENSMGRAVRNVTVNVIVKPIIEPFILRTPVRSGRSVVITCTLLEGNPEPTFRMEFTDRYGNKRVLSRDKGNLVYTINNVGQQHVGVYQCIAENSAGSDWIKVPLDVI